MQQIARTIALAYNNLPLHLRFMLVGLIVITMAAIIWRPFVYHPAQHPVVKNIESDTDQAHPLLPEASEPIDSLAPSANDDIPRDELDQKDEGETGVYEHIISTGDTLGSILTQYGIDISEVSQLASQNRDLRNLKIGQQLSWTVNDVGELQRLTWEVSRRESRIYDRIGNNFKETKEFKKGEWRNVVLKGRLNGNFISSAKAVGLGNAEIRAVTQALQWQLDFRKLHKGDQFSVLVSREQLGGPREQGQLLGVHMRSGGKDYYAIRAENGKFYDRKGNGLARGFMRFPTSRQFRISSPFNPRRVHPTTGRIAPHRGVDFAMPTGTPVLAVGDGEVLTADYSRTAGKYITIRHGRQYTTRYMHLKKLLVKPGQKVKRGDRIALSGNTGRSTGPHLHYEFWVNKQPVNPMTVKLPRSEGLSGQDRKDYLVLAQQVALQLG